MFGGSSEFEFDTGDGTSVQAGCNKNGVTWSWLVFGGPIRLICWPCVTLDVNLRFISS